MKIQFFGFLLDYVWSLSCCNLQRLQEVSVVEQEIVSCVQQIQRQSFIRKCNVQIDVSFGLLGVNVCFLCNHQQI